MHHQPPAPSELTRAVTERTRAAITNAGGDPAMLALEDGRLLVSDLAEIAAQIGCGADSFLSLGSNGCTFGYT